MYKLKLKETPAPSFAQLLTGAVFYSVKFPNGFYMKISTNEGKSEALFLGHRDNTHTLSVGHCVSEHFSGFDSAAEVTRTTIEVTP